MKYLLIGILLLGICGCSTIATRKDDGTLEIRGIGSAKWPDGAEITGEPIIKFPDFPSTIIGR